jgi:DNA-binding SARP family transcriptional activator
MVLLTVTLLGGFEACPASGAPLRLPKKAQALLAYLGLRLGQGQSRDKLAALLWGDKDDAQARDGLRHALAALRRALGGQSSRILQVEGQTLTLDPGRVEVDVATFERLISEKAAPTLEQATALYRGDLLLGFNLNEPFFEEWLVTERERLRELAVDGFTRLLGEQTRAGTRERAIQTGVRLLALDHLQEGVHRALMRLYAQQGRRGSALRQYQICVTALRRELGTEPEAETRKLYSELLRRSTDAVPPVDGDDAGRRAPEARTAPPELPAVETLLVGRQSELEHLRRMLGGAAAGHGRVVTVLGEAGIGKTRLVDALAADAPSLGCRVLIGRCHESDSILPFGPWVDACRVGARGPQQAKT